MGAQFTTAEGAVLKLSPFVLAATRVCLPKITEMQQPDVPMERATGLMVEVIVEALRRQNPDVTAAWLDEHIQTQELGDLLAAVLAASGLRKRADEPGEVKSP